jgi:hypothetical protein
MAIAQTHYRVDLWDEDGENIVDLLAEVGNFDVAMDTYSAAVKRWPGGVITLRQGARVIEDSRRTHRPHARERTN